MYSPVVFKRKHLKFTYVFPNTKLPLMSKLTHAEVVGNSNWNWDSFKENKIAKIVTNQIETNTHVYGRGKIKYLRRFFYIVLYVYYGMLAC